MVIQMNDYRKAKTVNPAAPDRRDEEALSVDGTQELSPKLPEDYAAVEPAFLYRVYALASQI